MAGIGTFIESHVAALALADNVEPMTLSSAQIEDAIKHNQVHGDRAIGEADKAVSLAPTLLLDAIDVLGQLGQIA